MNISNDDTEVKSVNHESVPTLKYLVSQSLGNCFDLQENNTGPERFERKMNPAYETSEGSGDIAAAVPDYSQSQAHGEIDVTTILSTAYEKGAEWLQAGAELASNIFGDELIAQRKNSEGAQSTLQPITKTLESLFAKCTIDQPLVNGLNIQEVLKNSTVDEKELTEVDDTAFYNGYSIRVRGKGIILDTMFVNGSGPSGKSLEILVRLQRPRNETNPWGKLVRENEDSEEQRVVVMYTHGFVNGVVEVVCPPEVDATILECFIAENGFMVITAP